MKIYLDVTSSCRSPRNSGMQRTTRGIFSALAARDLVTPICWNRAGNFYQRLGPRELECLTTPFRRQRGAVSRPDLRGEIFPAELRRMFAADKIEIASHLRGQDVLMVPDMFSDARLEKLPELIASSAARSVAVFHDAATLKLGLLNPPRAQKFRHYIEALAAFDLVVCISEESRCDLLEFWKQFGTVGPPQTCVEGWPIDLNERDRGAERKIDRKIILYVSSFTPRKNHFKLFQAAKKLWRAGHDFELRLIGASTGQFGLRVVPMIRWLQLCGWPIRWLKHVNDETLQRAYRECAFTVYPSLQEGFGLPILESLWHGKPCVCGRNGAIGEVAAGGGCLFVDQSDVDSLAAGIEQLLTNVELSDRLQKEARARAFRSWPDYIDSLLGHIREIGNAPFVSAAAVH